jgi:hypothetical protein
VRELISIPLYLTALLQTPYGALPHTKEEVLRLFIAATERKNADALREGFYDLHGEVLRGLAVEATVATNTAISEARSRSVVAEVEDQLRRAGQITEQPQPAVVLDLLVNHHTLMRMGGSDGVSFQHEQIQEWYASFEVEHLMREAASGNPAAQAKLRSDILDWRKWEEAVLFACERMSRADESGADAVAAAILGALAIDPMLAAEMIFRSSDTVWGRVGSAVQDFVRRWHAPATVDRALRFMMDSGRPGFLDQVWPLIAHEDSQVQLSAMRNTKRFRTSLLGKDAPSRIATLPPNNRKNILHDLVIGGGIDGIDLAAAIAIDDPDSEVKALVVDALAFRDANLHLVEVLRSADEETFDLVVSRDVIGEVSDGHVNAQLNAARERRREAGVSSYERLRAIIHAHDDKDLSSELTAIIADMEIDKKQDAQVALIYRAPNRYSRAIADGVLQRVRAGRTLFNGADDMLAAAGFSLEDDDLVGIALAATRQHDERAEAAASVLGPQAVGRMIDALFEVAKRVRDAGGGYDQISADRYHDLQNRIEHTSGASLIAAIRARAAQAGNKDMSGLAALISRHPNSEDDRGRAFDANALAAIAVLAEDWGNRMLASGGATRSQLADIADLVSHAPSVDLLPLLKRLLDEELRRYRAFRQEAEATGWRHGEALNEARTLHTLEYQRAFYAINTPETAALMREYLPDEHFGRSAATVLADHWLAANEPKDEKSRFRGHIDFSLVEEKRAARAEDPGATSLEAEAIFSVIERLIADGATDDQKKHAVALGMIAARLPHGERARTIQMLLSQASRRTRAALLQNLVLSGEIIDIELVRNGIAEVLEAARTHTWILWEGGYELKEWLRLLPFTNRTVDALAIVRGLPDRQSMPDFLEEMIDAFGAAPSTDAENVLFQLAETDPRFYANHAWLDAATRSGKASAARRIVDLAANGAFAGIDQWHMARRISVLIGEHPELRDRVYDLLKSGPIVPGSELLALAVAENPDAEGLLLLTAIDIEQKRSLISWRTLETVVTERVPVEKWKNAYNILPVPAAQLRQKLLDMTTDGSPSDAAARCLNQIDMIRDEYGAAESDPRHPDLASGRAWPIIPS